MDQHGCAKNQVDGELIISFLEQEGHRQTFAPEEADIIVVNSCGFIESAKKESLDAVMSAKAAYPDAKILLTGCLAQRYAEELRQNLPEADGIFGNGDLRRISEILGELMRGDRPLLVPQQAGVSCGPRRMLLQYEGSAYVKITEGCSNHCTFCAIPLIRGELRSRSAAEIVAEVQDLLSKGVFEINLIGQDLAAYGTGRGDDGTSLRQLLERISALQGNFWVRLLYIHPDHFDLDILPALAADSRILPYFDIPFQCGDDGLIRAMNRRGSAAQYVELARSIRACFPDAALRTTFMAGFPGESDRAAQNTLDFMDAVQPDWSGCFSYSTEEGTPAARLRGKVPARTAAVRADALRRRQAEITRKRLASRCGADYDVLVEEIVDGDEGIAIGRAWFQAPDVDGSVVLTYDRGNAAQNAIVRPGRLVRVRAVSSSDLDISGHLLGDSPLNGGRAAFALRSLP